MKKLALVSLFAILGAFAWGADLLPYDSAAVKDLMHSNQAAVGAVSKAIAAGDWNAVADGFIVYSANAKKALTYAPPKGDAAAWQKIWNEFLSAAYQGVGAAGAKDAVAAKKYLDMIIGDRNQGHGQFK